MGPEALQKKFEEESSTYMKLQKGEMGIFWCYYV